MVLLVSGSFTEVSLGINKLRVVFEVMKTAYYVGEDETVQVYIFVKLPMPALANPIIDTLL